MVKVHLGIYNYVEASNAVDGFRSTVETETIETGDSFKQEDGFLTVLKSPAKVLKIYAPGAWRSAEIIEEK